MDRSWNDRTDLITMQDDMERLIYSRVRINVRILDVIKLTREDYELLLRKLHCIRTAEEVDRFCLSIVIAWINSYNVGHPDEVFNIIDNLLRALPQHHRKFFFESFSTTMYDHQIDNFGLRLTDLSALEEIVRRHAGWIPDDNPYFQ